MTVLGQHLGAFRAQYFESESDGEHVNSLAGYSDPPETFVTSRILMDDFGSFVAADFRAGETVVVADTATDPRVSDADLRSYQSWGMGAYVAVPLFKGGRFVVCVGVHSGIPRDWSRLEIDLIEETAERTLAAVERARAEVALRESEERFAQFGRASSDGLWVRDAPTLALEYASEAMETIYGILDINLNGGRSFELAREMKRDGKPFVFITGYDQDVIPEDLADVRRLQKPVQFGEPVGALAGALEAD